MKVLQVLNHYLPQQVAGTEVYTSLLSKYLYNHGIAVKVIIPGYGASDIASYYHENIEVAAFAEPSKVDRSLIMGWRKPDGLGNFEKLLLQEQPDIVHFQELAGSNGITIYHVESAKKLGFKVVMTFHLAGYTCKTGNLMYKNIKLCDGVIDANRCTSCSYTSKGVDPIKASFILPVATLLHKLNINLTKANASVSTAIGFPFLIDQHKENLTRLHKNCDKVVSLTKWFSRILLKNGMPLEKISFIPQAIPQYKIQSRSNSYNVCYPIKLLFVGRISHYKGIHLLIEALQTLPPDKITLEIYGHGQDDEYEAKCRKICDRMSNIRWMGKIKPGSVVALMSNYHVLCLASTFSEMSPLVIQEAFAAGIPVIASDVYGNAEQIRHEINGLLFRFNDAEALRKELLKIIDNPSLLLDLAKNIQKPLEFNVIGSAYLKLYQEILAF